MRRSAPRPVSLLAFVLITALSVPASAQRVFRVSFTPTARAQIAIWLERADGTFVRTLAVTDATALRGIGNRPGALQMNSGFRWPYGRRESVLPIWAHRRAAAPGALPFPRVIFQDRDEGRASQTAPDQSRDEYYCLSFQRDLSRQDALDAVSCASVFSSDKGRYMTEEDVEDGYAEPFVTEVSGSAQTEIDRTLSLHSLYPMRRDIDGGEGRDHPDSTRFRDDARTVMPDIDAVSTATPAGDEPVQMLFTLDLADVPNGDYVLHVEVNTEGDHAPGFDPATYPTPSSNVWDSWAKTFGYAYIGQPAVLYSVPLTFGDGSRFASVDTPVGYAHPHGLDGEVRTMDASIRDDADEHPGSGADRLHADEAGHRVNVEIIPTSLCDDPDPPPECFMACESDADCEPGFMCDLDENVCLDICNDNLVIPVGAPLMFTAETHEDPKRSHNTATLQFQMPETRRRIDAILVRRLYNGVIDSEAAFNAADDANADDLDTIALELCGTKLVDNPIDPGGPQIRIPDCPAPGDTVDATTGQLYFEASYSFAVRLVDQCGHRSEFVEASVETTAIDFTTVSPCFVATAAYGTPLDDDIGILRRFRDRHLRSHAVGRALVDLYESFGPHLASAIARDERRRADARAYLAPIVRWAERLSE